MEQSVRQIIKLGVDFASVVAGLNVFWKKYGEEIKGIVKPFIDGCIKISESKNISNSI